MSLSLTYMGTKRHLAPAVVDLAAGCKTGPLLDAFSGMCAIGRAIAPDRQVWSNDLQVFAHQVATASFCDPTGWLDSAKMVALCRPKFEIALDACLQAFGERIGAEDRMLQLVDVDAADDQFNEGVSGAQVAESRFTAVPQFSLFSVRYGGSYFGQRQAAEADSIRAALESCVGASEISKGELRLALIALGIALQKSATTTGHFAQPLRPKKSNIDKFLAQRSRSVWSEWVRGISELKAYGTANWRQRNFAFQCDARDLLDDMRSMTAKPAVVYADPPYTKDQYSRYYHLLETIYLYDFPRCSGTGLYRDDRVASDFSQSSRVEEALDDLICATRLLDADLILSYPSDGLLPGSSHVIPQIIKSHYGKRPDILEITHVHSTMGGSKGKPKQQVREVLYKVSVQ